MNMIKYPDQLGVHNDFISTLATILAAQNY